MAHRPHPPVLRSASVSFHTNDEDKDWDTYVSVTAVTKTGITAAHIENDFGHFDDNSDAGPYAMIVAHASRKAVFRGSKVAIEISPVGNDTWRFNFKVTLVFSDGSELTASANGLQLDQDFSRQEFSFNDANVIAKL